MSLRREDKYAIYIFITVFKAVTAHQTKDITV